MDALLELEEYSITRVGATLAPIVHSLCDWGRAHASSIRD
ncbi:MAG TPA: winged helix-turn-helix transcriptional regulator [Kofleriaceae bacterium]